MKCLSIKQPWAWLIVNGYKPVENRTWRCDYRGPLLIHAGKNFDYEGYLWLKDKMPDIHRNIVQAFGIFSMFSRYSKPRILNGDFGGIVGSVNMVGCVETHPSPFFFGPWGFVLEDAKPLPFRPLPGQLGIFDVKLEDGGK